MGHARWDASAWGSYIKTNAGKSRAELFNRREIAGNLNPAEISVRESRDSAHNPNATPIIVGVDVTGSMGSLAEMLVKRGLKPLFEEILDRKPVTDPHVMAMAIGDAWCDRAPLQVTQFEADIRVAEQIQDIWIEGGGGGNAFESYNLPWYFAAMKTATDAMQKRKKKGYLFTVGDEPCPTVLKAEHVRQVIGDTIQGDLSSADVLAMAERSYEVFHVIVEEGSFFRHSPKKVLKSWGLLGQRVLRLLDHNKLSETIVSAIEITEGRDIDAVTSSWSGDTSVVVADAVRSLAPVKKGLSGLFRF